MTQLEISPESIEKEIDPQSYFEDLFAYEVWHDNYKHHQDQTIEDTWRRIAKSLASVEEDKEYWEEQFFDLLKDFKATPGGRIISNAGAGWQGTTLLNCFVGPKAEYDQDSVEGIVSTLLYQIKTLKSEGGWGMNFSFIRPRGSFIYGIGVESPGAIKYMELFDKSSEIITSGSGLKKKKKEGKNKIRKGAMMGVLDCWHPDIEEFITAKLQEGRLSKFNISVNCSNKFMNLIKELKEIQKHGDEKLLKDKDKWDLIFPDTKFEKYESEWDGNIEAWINKDYPIVVHKTVSALALWNGIMKSTYSRNDPGVLFLDQANKTHCFNYGKNMHISATNPCGEQTLPFGCVCDLGSLNLTQFVNISKRCFDIESLKKYTKILVRLLDNVNSYSNTPLEQYQHAIENYRRIGLGIMGWGSALYLLQVRYGSDEAESIKEEVMRNITHAAVEESVEIAKEKGAFTGCDFEKHASQPFWDQIELPEYLRNEIRKYGIRNSALFSIQPNGNSSVFANVITGGLEPVFLHEYLRTVIVNQVPDHIREVCPKFWEGEFKETSMFKFAKEGEDRILRGTDKNGTVYKIDKNRGLTREVLCEDYGVRHLKKLGLWNKDADWAVTTSNLTVKDHIKDMKGFGKWIDSSMSKTVNVPNDYPFEDFENLYLDAHQTGFLKGITTYRAGTMTTVLSGKSEENKNNQENPSCITKTNAPKRPKELPADVHHTSVKGEEYFVMVGNLEGEPYEIFAGKNGLMPRSVKSATIKKIKRGHYEATLDNGSIIENISDFISDDQEAITRVTSAALRHGADINFVVHQLEKTKGDLQSFAKATARCLKKHIPDGTKVHGEECPGCKGSNLQRREGCCLCQDCGWSKCV